MLSYVKRLACKLLAVLVILLVPLACFYILRHITDSVLSLFFIDSESKLVYSKFKSIKSYQNLGNIQQGVFYSCIEKIDSNWANYTNQVTIVSVYIQLNWSKHPQNEYNQWIKNMMTSVSEAPLVLIIDSQSYSKFKAFRDQKPTKYYVVESVWPILKQLELERNRTDYMYEYLMHQRILDPERTWHNPNLYALWNLKSYMVKKIAEENPFKSRFFIYTDAGAWRTMVIPNWPDVNFINNHLVHKLSNRMLLGQVHESSLSQVINRGVVEFKVDPYLDIIEGTFFAGSLRAIHSYYHAFFELHDALMDRGYFIGKDQTIINLLTFSSAYRKRIVRLKVFGQKCDVAYDPWFWYQLYFSNESRWYCNNNRLGYLADWNQA